VKQVIGKHLQATSYQNMSQAATAASNAANEASTFADITGGIKMIAGLETLFTGIPIPTGAPAGTSIGDPTQIGSLY
jgi:hypothetical protein